MKRVSCSCILVSQGVTGWNSECCEASLHNSTNISIKHCQDYPEHFIYKYFCSSCIIYFYDENHIFSIVAILKHKQVACMRRKNAVYFFSNISFCSRDIQLFKICKLAKWWRHILNQVLIKYDEKRYLTQFVSEMFDSLQ